MKAQDSVDIQIGVLQVEHPGQLDAGSLQRGIERELVRMITERGVPAGWNASHSIVDVKAAWEGQSTSEQDLAANIASSIYQALQR